MAIIGINVNRNNPEYTKSQFLFWQPAFKNFEDIDTYFDNIYPIVNEFVFKSIFGHDWPLAMSYAIAHYIVLIAQQSQTPAGTTLQELVGTGVNHGVLSSASIGGFSKTFDLDKTMSSDEEAAWWNQTSYGANFWTLMKTKHIPTIFVVTSGPITPKGN